MEKAFALIVGISNYLHINKLPELVLKDAQDINDLLIDQEHCGYLENNVTILKDSEATKTRILNEVGEIAEKSRKLEDIVVFIYISSHGGRIRVGRDSGEYLLPVDTNISLNEDNHPCFQNAISNSEFTTAIESIKASKVVIIFDCCHSAGIAKQAEEPISRDKYENGFSNNFYEFLIKGRGWAILASSRSNEASYIMRNDNNSLFTKHLLAGMKGNVQSFDNYVRVFNLFEYIQPKVTSENRNQHPVFKCDLEENFVVARNPTAKRPQLNDEGFLYDVYITYADENPDLKWVWEELVPHLEQSGLRIAVSGVVEEPGTFLVVSMKQAVEQAKRTVVILSKNYLEHNMARFQSILAFTTSIRERRAKVFPIAIEDFEESKLPGGMDALVILNVTKNYGGQENFKRLPNLLKAPLNIN